MAMMYCKMEDCVDVHYCILYDKCSRLFMDLNTIIVRGRSNRGNGKGTQVLKYLLNLAEENGCEYIELTADTKQPQLNGFILVDWYKKYGFKVISKNGWLVLMRKQLK